MRILKKHERARKMATNKSAGERRANISPSDLTFSWDGCHRCLWLYYNHQIKAPMFMPTVAELADLLLEQRLLTNWEELPLTKLDIG